MTYVAPRDRERRVARASEIAVASRLRERLAAEDHVRAPQGALVQGRRKAVVRAAAVADGREPAVEHGVEDRDRSRVQ